MNKRTTGIGGVFFKAQNPKELAGWYEKHLGIEVEAESFAATLRWRELDNPEKIGATVWGIFPHDSNYMGDPKNQAMINYRVEDLDALLALLKAEGVQMARDKVEDTDYGRFAWIVDPEGNRIELWQPPDKY